MEETPTEYLSRQGNKMRESGCRLAEAASYVIRESDGVHRLAQAVAEWYQTLANQGEGRSTVS